MLPSDKTEGGMKLEDGAAAGFQKRSVERKLTLSEHLKEERRPAEVENSHRKDKQQSKL